MPIVNRFLADTGRFVSGTGQNGLDLWIFLCYLVIYLVKGHTIREIAGRHDCFRHKAVLVADNVGFRAKLPFMFSFRNKPLSESVVRFFTVRKPCFFLRANFFSRCCLCVS